MNLSQSPGLSLKRLWWAGPVTIVAAVIANAIVLALLVVVLNPAETFQPLRSPAFVPFTIIGVLGAVIAFALVARFAPNNPLRMYHLAAVIALVLSCLPNVFFAISPPTAPNNLPAGMPFPFAGGTSVDWLALIVLHGVAYAISVWLLPMLTREKV
jgi:hypothetical protein